MTPCVQFLPRQVRLEEVSAHRAHLADCLELRRKFAGAARKQHGIYIRRVIRAVRALEASL